MSQKGARPFPSTQWSLIIKIKDGSQDAMGEVCDLYWAPIYSFARRMGNSPERAADLTQDFFQHTLKTEFWQSAERTQGRLRGYLIGAFKRVAAKNAEIESAIKRGGDREIIPLEPTILENAYSSELHDLETPDLVYERSWAKGIFYRSLEALAEQYRRNGQGLFFEALSNRLEGDRPNASYAELSDDLEMSVGAIKTGVVRMKKRFRDALREEIAKTVTSSDEIDHELRYVLRVLAS